MFRFVRVTGPWFCSSCHCFPHNHPTSTCPDSWAAPPHPCSVSEPQCVACTQRPSFISHAFLTGICLPCKLHTLLPPEFWEHKCLDWFREENFPWALYCPPRAVLLCYGSTSAGSTGSCSLPGWCGLAGDAHCCIGIATNSHQDQHTAWKQAIYLPTRQKSDGFTFGSLGLPLDVFAI